jgi:hypothetical protein
MQSSPQALLFLEILKNKKKKLFCAFVDFEKAFDTVWRDALWYKILLNNINGNMYQVIFDMYQNIKSCLFYDGKNCIQDDQQFHKNILPAIMFIRNRIQSRNIFMYEKDLVPYETSNIPTGDWIVFSPHHDDEAIGMGGSSSSVSSL